MRYYALTKSSQLRARVQRYNTFCKVLRSDNEVKATYLQVNFLGQIDEVDGVAREVKSVWAKLGDTRRLQYEVRNLTAGFFSVKTALRNLRS